MKKSHVSLVLALLLAACSSDTRPDPIRLDYSQYGKISLNTQDVRVINRARDPQAALARQFKPRLSEAVSRWATDRLQATGTAGHTTVIIKDASLTESELPVEKGLSTWFTRQQGRKYVARVEMVIEAESPVTSATGLASAHAVQAVTLPENPTEDERYTAYKSILDSVMSQFNQSMEQAARKHLARFMDNGSVTSPSATTAPTAPAPTNDDSVSVGEE